MEIDEKQLTTVEELSKSQNIRLIDVFFIGPFMIYFANKAKGISELERTVMYILAGATILYNAKNYHKNKKNELK